MSADDSYKGLAAKPWPRLEKLQRPGLERCRDSQHPRRLHRYHPCPRSETADPYHIVLKLPERVQRGHRRHRRHLGHRHRRPWEAHYKIPEKEFPFDPKKTGSSSWAPAAPSPAGSTTAPAPSFRPFRPWRAYGSVPELADICNLETEKLYGVFSENMGPEQWRGTAEAIGREIAKGVQGIVIGHGTDTMHHTAAILSFMVQDSPVPIVMVGSQRSSDRPSSDAAR